MNSVLQNLLDVFREPSVIVGLIALLGLVLQRKSLSDTIKGTTKAFVGFLVLAAGAGVVSDALTPFGDMFQHAFGVQGVVPNNEAIVGKVLTDYGSQAALIFFFGMVVNVLLARFTRFKFIYMSGHVALYLAAMIAVILIANGFSSWQAVLWGALAQGLITTLSPALVQPWMRKATKNDNVALGHTGNFGIATSGLVGKLFGNPEKSTEDLKIPKGLGFLRDTTVVIASSMGVIYLLVTLVAGQGYVEDKLSDGQWYLLWAVMQAGKFAAGVFIILAGVRVVLAEIIPAFKGISEKLVPNARPALDVPIVFTFAPNAVLIGFLSSFVGGLIGMGVLVAVGGTIIIPGIVAHFMTGAASGVLGNATGGRRGAVLGAMVNGLLITFLPLLVLPFLGDVGLQNSTFSDADFGVSGLLLGGAVRISHAAVIGLILCALAAVFVGSALTSRRRSGEEEAATAGERQPTA
ncbi:PTS ascorbate transporter subunit IIC [Streptomyces hygroscopicus]|uniref:Ascorbate-specific PTS system EIIC component n=3 Tax=Streptomyces TaxID=1883 RepID=A0ABT9L5M2_9ACTN|nr:MULTISPECIES: PTS ascorbate transporter subunit IIC [Streptomyces]MDP9616007.1 PTS system ascorbate-specific IIC component [Streptomyces demainii]GHJ33918.1 PTS ascorbate transporter subunit IIC [Streptomyces hygroscopicus]